MNKSVLCLSIIAAFGRGETAEDWLPSPYRLQVAHGDGAAPTYQAWLPIILTYEQMRVNYLTKVLENERVDSATSVALACQHQLNNDARTAV
ncbi:hypothetical protein HZB60_06330 [candidate division KSB1 bacterium]|nr:hypothetical protein [candidate division KSB1 bacterium]